MSIKRKKRQLLVKKINLWGVLFICFVGLIEPVIRNRSSVEFILQIAIFLGVTLFMIINIYIPRLKNLEVEIKARETQENNKEADIK